MLTLFPSTSSTPRPSNANPLSLNAAAPPIAPKTGSAPEHPIFAAIDDDLKDARRVGTHGEEEDLRSALEKVIGRIEELSTLLRDAYRTTTDLEASLGIARSNLTLVQSNNEMLEEALKSGNAKDVGWRRWSAREGQQQQQQQLLHRAQSESNKSSKSLDYAPLSATSDSTASQGHPSPHANTYSSSTASSPILSSPLASASIIPQTPVTSSEPRFFRSFRFGGSGTTSGASTPALRSSRSPTRSPALANDTIHPGSSNLTSPSLPSLVSKDLILEREKEKERKRLEKEKEQEKRLDELEKKLEKERESRMKAAAEKAALEAEIESLSQALFEEANKMVATERIKRAETEEELQEARMEQEALKSALKLVETENGRLRRGSVIPAIAFVTDEEGEEEDGQDAEDVKEIDTERRRAIYLGGIAEADSEQGPSSRSSSRIGLKSPTTSRRSSVSRTAATFSQESKITETPPGSSPSSDEYSTPSGSMLRSHSKSLSHPQLEWDYPLSIPDPTTQRSGMLPDTQPDLTSSSSPFSLPNSFGPSSSGSYIAEEPSPWA